MIVTKRSVLSSIARIFDLIYMIALSHCDHCEDSYKNMQSLWLLKLGWDDVLPDNLFIIIIIYLKHSKVK